VRAAREPFVDSSVCLSLPRIPRRVRVSVSSRPSRNDDAAPGYAAIELRGQGPELVERPPVA
jgi:hypothetical protein